MVYGYFTKLNGERSFPTARLTSKLAGTSWICLSEMFLDVFSLKGRLFRNDS